MIHKDMYIIGPYVADGSVATASELAELYDPASRIFLVFVTALTKDNVVVRLSILSESVLVGHHLPPQ
jgi:hypothetical protein